MKGPYIVLTITLLACWSLQLATPDVVATYEALGKD